MDVKKLGNKTLVARLDFEGEEVELSKKIRILSDEAPDLYTYEIVNEFPHGHNSLYPGPGV